VVGNHDPGSFLPVLPSHFAVTGDRIYLIVVK